MLYMENLVVLLRRKNRMIRNTDNMKRTVILLALCAAMPMAAQESAFERLKEQMNARFDSAARVLQEQYGVYSDSIQAEYDAFRRRVNEEYAGFMRQKWTEYESKAAKSRPEDRNPPAPVVKKGDEPKRTDEIRYTSVAKAVPYEAPQPVVPIAGAFQKDIAGHRFMFHGTPCEVSLTDVHRYTLPDATEQSASDMWLHLSDPAYNDALADCLRLRDELKLADWGYINLVQTMTRGFFGKDCNEAVLMQVFVLAQSGYAARIASTGEKWLLLVPFDTNIYDYSFIDRDGLAYYILDKDKEAHSFYVFDNAFQGEKVSTLRMTESPRLNYSPTEQRTLASQRWPSMTSSITGNRNLISFYNDYPLSSNWDCYSAASLSPEIKNALFPALRREIAGKSEYDAANMLLNFVQTAFDYETDGEQFGYERPLFGDETLYYPYSDCEDRSILYSVLVRELLNLEVVLLEYPGHVATAVAFGDNQPHGTFVNHDNKVYTVCDPTYINADAGECMPEYRHSSAQIIHIQ